MYDNNDRIKNNRLMFLSINKTISLMPLPWTIKDNAWKVTLANKYLLLFIMYDHDTTIMAIQMRH